MHDTRREPKPGAAGAPGGTPGGAAAADATDAANAAQAATADAGDDEAPEKPAKAESGLPEQLCLRCAAAPPNALFLPCSHKVWCVDCAQMLPSRCPICDTGVTQSLRTFHKRL